MPIVDVEIVERPGEGLAPGLAARLADALGGALDAAPGKVWVRLRALAAGHYAESGAGEGRPSPVFVTLLASVPPEGGELDRMVGRVTEAVSRVACRPAENVHVLVQPAARGRIAFGGKVVR